MSKRELTEREKQRIENLKKMLAKYVEAGLTLQAQRVRERLKELTQ